MGSTLVQLLENSPSYMIEDHFKEYEGELYCFRKTCEGCQYINDCDFIEESINISDHANLRKAFKARDGFFLFAMDYSGVELRVCAIMSGEELWVKEFNLPPMCPEHGDRSEQYHLNVKCSICGSKLIKADLHTKTAQLIRGLDVFNSVDKDTQKSWRQQGKTCNFGLLYGGNKYTLVRASKGAISLDEGDFIVKKFFKGLPGITKWHKTVETSVKSSLYVTTYFGRTRPIPEAQATDFKTLSYGVRTAWNHEVQGTAADLMKIAMLKVHNLIEKNNWGDVCKMLLTVHDEIVFEIHEDWIDIIVPQVADMLQLKFLNLPVPLEIDVEYDLTWDASYRYTGPPFKKPEKITKSKVNNLEVSQGPNIINKRDFNQDLYELKAVTSPIIEKIHTYQLSKDFDGESFDFINTILEHCPGEYKLHIILSDGVKIELENRLIDPIKFEQLIS